MSKIFNTQLLKATSYIPPQRDKNLIRLDSMEHPFALVKQVSERMKDSLDEIELNRYPKGNMDALEEKIKKIFAIDSRLGILFGNGSDELIEMLILATPHNAPIFSFNPSFSMYQLLIELLGRKFISVDLDRNFQINLEQTLNVIEKNNPPLIFIAEPNNPTGQSFDIDVIETICKKAKGLVVLDEAYFAFSKQNMLKFVNEQHFSNVLILRTLSKMGFAGIRFGFLIGSKALIETIRPLRLPYNINSFNQKLIDIALDYFSQTWDEIKLVCSYRDEMLRIISQIDGVETYPSDTNFLLVKVRGLNSTELTCQLLKENISVKDLKSYHPLVQDCIRVSMGLQEENQYFIKALQKIARKQDKNG